MSMLNRLAPLFGLGLFLLASSTAQAELMVSCPFSSVQTGIVAPIPQEWSQTPALNTLAETRIDRQSGEPVLVCLYAAGNTLSRTLPTGIIDCEASQGGFVCEPGERTAPPTHDTCIARVQGVVAWNNQGDTRWNDVNVARLCRGTSAPAEPGLCFDRIMRSDTGTADDSEWQWQQALDLCEGTSDAARTIRCLKQETEQGGTRTNAIAVCGR